VCFSVLVLLYDNCFKIRDIPNIDELGDEPIWVGGAIHHPTSYKKGTTDWEKTIELNDGINNLKTAGVRVTSLWGLYIPKWQQAEQIAKKMKESKVYKTPDAHISTLKVVKRLYYPALFTPRDNGTSAVQSKGNRWNNTEYFKYRKYINAKNK